MLEDWRKVFEFSVVESREKVSVQFRDELACIVHTDTLRACKGKPIAHSFFRVSERIQRVRPIERRLPKAFRSTPDDRNLSDTVRLASN
jgi:hypothetical protein